MIHDAPPLDLPRLRRWRIPLRLAWLAGAGIIVSQFLLSLRYYYQYAQGICLSAACPDQRLNAAQALALHDLGLTVQDYAAWAVFLTVVFGAVFLGTALLIFWQRPDDGSALFASFTLLLFGLATFSAQTAALSENPFLQGLAQITEYVGGISIFIFFAIFPSGRLVTWWSVPILVLYSVFELFHQLLPDLSPLPQQLVSPVSNVIFVFTVLGSVLSQIYRYRYVSTPRERQQTKWVVYGSCLGIGVFLILVILFSFVPPLEVNIVALVIGNSLLYVALMSVPISIAIAVLRSHLWDVDVLIRRTVTYSVVTLLLVLVYFAGVIVLERILAYFTATASSEPVTVLSTLAIAALFVPVRNRVQTAWDANDPSKKSSVTLSVTLA